MFRDNPRSRLPESLAPIFNAAKSMKLFLLAQYSPTSFLFQDLLRNEHRVSIGERVSCSCLPGNNDHCMHSFYVMLRIYKVDENDPIVWKSSYTEQDISDILAGRHSKKQEKNPETKSKLTKESTGKKTELMAKKKQTHLVQKLELEEESVCPICQESLLDGSCLSYCDTSCGNNYHSKCLKIWIQHKLTSKTQISCPMCRTVWKQNFLEQINLDEEEHMRANKTYYRTCVGCKEYITQNFHMCIFCKDVYLCKSCYENFKHAEHDKFLTRKSPKDNWQPAEQRAAMTLSTLAVKEQTDQLNPFRLCKLTRYLITCFPSVEKDLFKLYKGRVLDFDPKAVSCMQCGQITTKSMRRLYCKHFIDEQCLGELIESGAVQCPADKCVLLHGYKELRKQEERNKSATSDSVKDKSNTQKRSSSGIKISSNQERIEHHTSPTSQAIRQSNLQPSSISGNTPNRNRSVDTRNSSTNHQIDANAIFSNNLLGLKGFVGSSAFRGHPKNSAATTLVHPELIVLNTRAPKKTSK